MSLQKDKHPCCYGNIEIVFPMGRNELRETPAACFQCRHKTPCLRSAMADVKGLKVRQEFVDRAYSSGRITFWERWSRKKIIERCKKDKTDTKGPGK
jgi:hypothetical protein